MSNEQRVPIELVIFDCDGTLVDSETLVAEVTAECARDYGIELTAAEAYSRYRGGRMADCVKDLETMRGGPLPESFVTDVRERQNIVLRERLQPMEGAVELLEAMHLPYCMASNGLRAKMEVTLGTTGLLRFFHDRIFSAYEVGSWKPEPDLFLHAAREFNVPPAHCAVIEDSLPGILGGIAAGMRVFALLEPDDAIEDLPAGVTIIHSLHELHEHLVAPASRRSQLPSLVQ